MSENTTHAAGENTNPAAVGYHHVTDLKGHQMNMPMNSMRRTDMTTKAQATTGRGVLRVAVAQASEQLAARPAAWNLRARADQGQAREVVLPALQDSTLHEAFGEVILEAFTKALHEILGRALLSGDRGDRGLRD